MGCEIEKMVLDLNQLLKDICKFLSSDKLEKLSPKDQKLAESLINRSKKQLQEIEKIQPTLQSSEEYVEMKEDVQVTMKPEKTIVMPSDDPYRDLAAKDASYNVKFGWISMRRKFLLGFEKMKRVYATIHRDWLLIYVNDKDIKPLCTINLKAFEAKESDAEKCNFELVSLKENDSKVFYFLALTHKDMRQWAAHINRCRDVPKHFDEGQYCNTAEMIPNDEDDDPDKVYEVFATDISPSDIKLTNAAIRKGGPIISNTFPRRDGSHRTKLPVKVPPPVIEMKPKSANNSSDSLASYYEIRDHGHRESNTNSTKSCDTKSFDDDWFSESSEDSTYETFANIKQSMQALNKPANNPSVKSTSSRKHNLAASIHRKDMSSASDKKEAPKYISDKQNVSAASIDLKKMSSSDNLNNKLIASNDKNITSPDSSSKVKTPPPVSNKKNVFLIGNDKNITSPESSSQVKTPPPVSNKKNVFLIRNDKNITSPESSSQVNTPPSVSNKKNVFLIGNDKKNVVLPAVPFKKKST